ncbi:MAG: hypothetical protein ACR2F6_03085 [Mycobacteriales bacterium]
MPDALLARALRSAGLCDDRLTRAASAANEVWLGRRYVVKIGTGRFRDSLRHERRVLAALSADVPHPVPVADGRTDGRDWLVLQRLPGAPLSQVWPDLDQTARARVADEIAAGIGALHATPRPETFGNPWLTDALESRPADLYHAPPDRSGLLIDATRGILDHGLLDDLAAALLAVRPVFSGDRMVLAHTDLHATNILLEGSRLTGFLDFEGARPAAADQELDALIRFSGDDPDLSPLTEAEKGLRAPGLSRLVLESSSIRAAGLERPHERERLATHAILWLLVQALNLPPHVRGTIEKQLRILLARLLK